MTWSPERKSVHKDPLSSPSVSSVGVRRRVRQCPSISVVPFSVAAAAAMGALFSTSRAPPPAPSLPPPSCKRPRLSSPSFSSLDPPQIIPGIPDELSVRILARVPRSSYFSLRLVCRNWFDVLSSAELFDIRHELGSTEEWLYVLMRDDDENLSWHALDPASGRWQRLPPMPEMVPEEEIEQPSSGLAWWGFPSVRLTELLKGLFRRKDAVDRSPFCGCAAGAICGCLYVLGGFSRACAMKSVWRYDPRTNDWREAAAMGTPRAYCKTALLHNKLYAVGGVNRGRGGLTPLQSAEVYEPSINTWKPVPSMPFAKAQVLPTAFLADMLKPIATGMASFRGKLCVPQSLYSWPFFVDVGGEVFDPVTESWIEMPKGMGEGWPARQAGTKLSVVVNGSLYALDPTSSLDGSKIKVYDTEADSWKVVLKKVPILLDLTDSESPYLLAGFWDMLHVITKDMHGHIIVLRADMNETPAAAAAASASSTSSSSTSTSESSSEPETDGWKNIARRNFGSVELVTCQVLDV